MLTAMSDTAVAEHCLVNGAQGYIRKGGDPESLQRKIAEQIEMAFANTGTAYAQK